MKITQVKGGKPVKGDGSKPVKTDIYIEYGDDGVKRLRYGYDGIPDTVVNADGAYVLPAPADIGCRLYDSAFPARESELTSEAAAFSGGYGDILALPPTGSSGNYANARLNIRHMVRTDSPDTVRRLGKGFYTADKWISDSGRMRELLSACAETGSTYFELPCDTSICGGVINCGRVSRATGLAPIHDSAELTAISRDMIFSYETGARLHFTAISLRSSADLIRYGKKNGVPVTAGISPLNIAMTENGIAYYGSLAKLMPPLRTRDDVTALREALADGTVDCVSSLHTPCTPAEKGADITAARFGASSIDTAVSTAFTYLDGTKAERLDLMVRTMSLNSAAIIGIDASVRDGGRGEFILFYPDKKIIVSSNTVMSKSAATPLMGLTLYGTVRRF